MRISEIANAEEQVGLLKIIMDKTWEAIATQQRQQAQQAQQKAASKPRTAKPRSPKAPYAPPPPKLPSPRKPLAQAKSTHVQKQLPVHTNQQARVATFGKSLPLLQKASNDSKDGFLQQRSAPIEKIDGKEDRYS
jgi:hypothetical protein